MPLAIGVRPTVQTEMTLGAEFRYEYRVGNESRATKRISRWLLELATLGDHIRSIHGPVGWGFETWELPDERVQNRLSVMNLIRQARPVTARELVRNQASWWYRGLGGDTLEPGTCCLTFILDSTNLPGIVTAYFQGTPYKVSTTAEVPWVLRKLVPAFNFIETNSVSMPVIGPSFEAATPAHDRLCAIIADVKELLKEQRLEPTPLTKVLVPLSAECGERSVSEIASALDALPTELEGAFEREILSAIEVNLAFQ